jgi:hypothetical protein
MTTPMRDWDEQNSDRLSEADTAALDRLIEAGLEPAYDADARTNRVMSLLGLLGTPVAGETDARTARVDVTVLRARRAAQAEADAQPLHADDMNAVDRWMDGVSDAGSDRVARVESLAALAASGPPSDPAERAARIERVMAAVSQEESFRAERMTLDQGPELSGWRMRLADVISIAAMLLLGASVALPAMNAVGQRQERLACLNNMQTSARAFGTYAGDHADFLPMATAGFGGSRWMDVGTKERSNSANLFTLVRTGYEGLDDLACAGNPHAARGAADPGAWDWDSMQEISYSYRIMPNGGLRMTLPVATPAQVVVTADRSPVTLRIAAGLPVIPEANSPNHAGRGQYVLRLDGSADWERSPVVGGDNIWLPRSIETVIRQVRERLDQNFRGTEIPDSPTDAFVGP